MQEIIDSCSNKEENAEKKIRRKLQKRAACVHCHRHGVGRSLLEAGGRGHDLRVEVRGGFWRHFGVILESF